MALTGTLNITQTAPGTASVVLGNDNQIRGGANITMSGGLFDLNGHVDSIGSLTMTNGAMVSTVDDATGMILGTLTPLGPITTTAGTGPNSINGQLSLGGLPLSITTVGSALTINAVIIDPLATGSLTLTAGASANILLGGANTYVGSTKITTGTVQFNANGAGMLDSNVILSPSTTLDMNMFNATVGELSSVSSGSGTIKFDGSETLTVGKQYKRPVCRL